jgi:hypothetical protein
MLPTGTHPLSMNGTGDSRLIHYPIYPRISRSNEYAQSIPDLLYPDTVLSGEFISA